MSLADKLWMSCVRPPEFAVGDEVCYYKSAAKDILAVVAVRTTASFDGDETFQEIMIRHNDYWFPASQFVRVRKIT